MPASDVVDLFAASAGAFRSVLTGVRADQHHLPPPCEPLDVSGLVARAIGHQDWVRGRVAGGTEPPAYPPVEPGAWPAVFDRSTDAMIAELRRSGSLDRTVTLAAGLTFPGSDVAVLAARNIFQYGWDLAV